MNGWMYEEDESLVSGIYSSGPQMKTLIQNSMEKARL